MKALVRLRGRITWVLGGLSGGRHYSWIRIGNWRIELGKLR